MEQTKRRKNEQEKWRTNRSNTKTEELSKANIKYRPLKNSSYSISYNSIFRTPCKCVERETNHLTKRDKEIEKDVAKIEA